MGLDDFMDGDFGPHKYYCGPIFEKRVDDGEWELTDEEESEEEEVFI